jgi:hypothetical protein
VRVLLLSAGLVLVLVLVDRYLGPLAPVGQTIAEKVGLSDGEATRSGS